MAKRIVQLPFVGGQREDIDERMLPQGLLHSAVNARVTRDGRVTSRNGWKQQTLTAAPPVMALEATDIGAHYYAGNDALLKRANNLSDSVSQDVEGVLSRYVPHSTIELPAVLDAVVATPDSASGNGYVVVAAAYENGSETEIHAIVLNSSLGSVVWQGKVHSPVAGEPDRIRVVFYDTTFAILYDDNATTVYQTTWDSSSGSVSWSTPAAAFTIISGSRWDAVNGGSVGFWAAFQILSTVIRFSKIRANGTVAVTDDTTVASDTYNIGCAANSLQQIWVATISGSTSTLHYAAYDDPLTTKVTGTKTIATGVHYAPTINTIKIDGTTATYFAGITGASGSEYTTNLWQWEKPAFGVLSTPWETDEVRNHVIASRPLDSDTGLRQVWMVHEHLIGTGDVIEALVLCDLTQTPNLVGLAVAKFIEPQCVVARGVALQQNMGDAQPGASPWGKGIVWPAHVENFDLGGVFNKNRGVRLYLLEDNESLPERKGVRMGGSTYFPGAYPRVLDEVSLQPNGFADIPVINSVTSKNGSGSLTSSATYSYIAVHEWVDAQGQRHQSEPSTPKSVTLGSSDDTVDVEVSRPLSWRRESPFGASVMLYRTLANGSVYFFVDSSPEDFATTAYITIEDTAADVNIDDRSVVYTTGASGEPLPHVPAPACRGLVAGNERLMAWGLFERSQVQWSKLYIPGEPVQWADSNAFRAFVTGDITGAAEQDGRWIIFTYNAIFFTSGAGPDDLGVGAYPSPERIPSPAGCIDSRSIVEAPEGVFFQGAADRMYILPRGGSSPQWIGQPVRDTMANYPVIKWAIYSKREQRAYWVAVNSADTDSRLLVWDSRNQQWFVDRVPYNPGSPVSAVVFEALAETDSEMFAALTTGSTDGAIATLSQDYDTIESTDYAVGYEIETGDILPFGHLGWGRMFSVTLLGTHEQSGVTARWLDMHVSYDSGGSWVGVTFGVADGDTFERQYYPSRIKGRSFRFRFRSYDAGAAADLIHLHGYALEIEQASHAVRLSSGDRL